VQSVVFAVNMIAPFVIFVNGKLQDFFHQLALMLNLNIFQPHLFKIFEIILYKSFK